MDDYTVNSNSGDRNRKLKNLLENFLKSKNPNLHINKCTSSQTNQSDSILMNNYIAKYNLKTLCINLKRLELTEEMKIYLEQLQTTNSSNFEESGDLGQFVIKSESHEEDIKLLGTSIKQEMANDTPSQECTIEKHVKTEVEENVFQPLTKKLKTELEKNIFQPCIKTEEIKDETERQPSEEISSDVEDDDPTPRGEEDTSEIEENVPSVIEENNDDQSSCFNEENTKKSRKLNQRIYQRKYRERRKKEKHIIKCSKCEKTYQTETGLREHVDRHHSNGLRKYKCKKCSSAFKTRSDLYHHYIFKHTDVKKFKCTTCKEAFKNSTYLRHHIEKHHTKNVKYVCYLCKNVYKTKDNLRSHMKSRHVVERKMKYSCTKCSMKFNLMTEVTRHKHDFHNKAAKVFKCKLCPQAFSFNSGLHRHVRRIHCD